MQTTPAPARANARHGRVKRQAGDVVDDDRSRVEHAWATSALRVSIETAPRRAHDPLDHWDHAAHFVLN